MTEEEIEWFEENWNRGKSRIDSVATSREYKAQHTLWRDWGDYKGYHYWNDRNCWKSQRKTHYRIKKFHNKKRKPIEREHWRFKKHWHSYMYQNLMRSIYYAEKRRRMLDS